MKLVEISELFSVSYGHKLDLNKMKLKPDGVAFVNRTGFQNGVVAYVEEIEKLKPSPSGCLTIALGGSVLSTFLQIKPFYTGQNVAIATPKQAMTNAVLLYYATAIQANKFRYSTCGREANRTFRSILIPDISEIPSWIHQANVDMYDGADTSVNSNSNYEIQTDTWQFFELQTLFEIKKGKRLTKANQLAGYTPYIGAIDKNNGISSFIGQQAIHEGGIISVSYNGSVAEAFYQPEPFWATDDVNVLYPKFQLTPAIALFIATLIRQEKYRFNYGRKWHLERMRESQIRLPVKPDSTPDWDFMEQYIKSLPYSSQIE